MLARFISTKLRLRLSHNLKDSRIFEKAKLFCESVFVQGLSLYYLKIVQMLLEITTVGHQKGKEKWAGTVNEQMISLKRQTLLEYLESLWHWVPRNQRRVPSSFPPSRGQVPVDCPQPVARR